MLDLTVSLLTRPPREHLGICFALEFCMHDYVEKDLRFQNLLQRDLSLLYL